MVNLAVAQVSEDQVAEIIPNNIGQTGEAENAEIPLFADPDEVPEVDQEIEDGMGNEVESGEINLDAVPVEDEDGGFLISGANINDIFQLLAKRADKQYFHNNQLNAEEYKVTGHLNGDTSPLKQMEELAFQYGLRMYVKGNTVYAMLDNQLEKLPAKEWVYSLNYLRPTDIEQIKALITPMLSPGRGIVNYEPKTNTIIVIDTMHHIEMVESLLKKVDRPKGQIVIETKILRVNSQVDKNIGVDWANALGTPSTAGVGLSLDNDISSLFGLDTTIPLKGNVILDSLQISGLLKALNESGIVENQSNPIIITEDNETANISFINRIPIITTSTTSSSAGSEPTVTEEVRYKIDDSDSTDPETTREIGVTVSMTPSLLPDGTIRIKMRPRNAEVVGEVVSSTTGNVYPEVDEATVETIARIPDGNSLLIGGFYSLRDEVTDNKVPLLGDIPVVNFFFKSKSTQKKRSSLVFVVTPTSYDPANVNKSNRMSHHVNHHLELKPGYDHVEDSNPGNASDANFRRTIRGMKSSVEAAAYPER